MKNLKFIVPVLVALAIGFVAGTCSTPEPEHHHPTEAAQTWTCSMHPEVQQPEPGTCPICAMDLIPVSSEGPVLANDQVSLKPHAEELAGIQTTSVKSSGANDVLRLTGQLSQNRTQTREITAWFSGRLDKLRVASEGASVKRGQTVAYLYSPEIYAAHQDLLVAQEQLRKLADADPFAKNAIEAAVSASKTKLRLMGMPETQIAQMTKAKTASTRVPLRSPFAGTVVKKRVNEGAYVKVGTPILELANLDTLWVELDAYPEDLVGIQIGDEVKFTVEGESQPRTGKVSFIEPVVRSAARTTVVRVEIPNDSKLRPGALVSATLKTEKTEPLSMVPASSVLFGGDTSIVYVRTKKSPSVYEAREVVVGSRFGDWIQIVEGVAVGESVVTNGAFTLDADLQIRGGLSLMNRPKKNVVQTSPEFDLAFESVLNAYLEISSALAGDDYEKSASAWQRLTQLELPTVEGSEFTIDTIRTAIVDVPKTIDGVRKQFQPLSNAMIAAVGEFGNPTQTPLNRAHCPMAFDNSGADWLQRGSKIQNAYFGSEMLRCGTIEQGYKPSRAEPESQPESR